MRAVLFFLSFFGWMELARQRTRVNICFLPVMTASAQTLLMIVCGMCGVLLPAAYAVMALGLAALVSCAVKERQRILLPWCNAGSLFSLIGITVLFVLLRGKVVGHFDNFTHWALIVRHLLKWDALPGVQDTMITYSNYPLGSSLWIYLFSTCTGLESEDMWLWAQGIYMVLCLQTLFVCVEGRRSAVVMAAAALLTAVYANFALSYNVTVYNLLVDAMLPLCGLALSLAAGWEYLHVHDGRLALRTDAVPCPWHLIPLMGMAVQIKVSGLVFLLLPLGLMLLSALRSKSRPVMIKAALATAAPLALLLVWNIRHALVFAGTDAGRHAISLATMQEKSLQELGTIVLGVLRAMLADRDMLFLLVPVLTAFLAMFTAQGHAVQVCIRTLMISAAVYAAYVVGIACLYIFSMPLQEALTLAGITRYRRTMLIWLYGLMYASMLYSLAHPSGVFAAKRAAGAAVGVLMLLCLTAGWYFTHHSYNRLVTLADGYHCDELQMRFQLEQIIADEHVEDGGRYLLYLPPEKNSSYHQVFYGYLLRYLVDSDQVSVTTDRSTPATPGTWGIHLPN